MIRRTTNPRRRPEPEPEVRSSRKRAQATAPVALNETKAALIRRLLARPLGASLDELTAATSWQPHTVRATLSGLRKKGHGISKDKVDGVTRYTIEAAALVAHAKPSASKKRGRS